MTILEEATPVARKAHGCCVCLGVIGSGDSYQRQRIVDGSEAWVAKFHTLCGYISHRVAKDIGYWPEEGFDPQEEIWPLLRDWFGAAFLLTGGGEIDG